MEKKNATTVCVSGMRKLSTLIILFFSFSIFLLVWKDSIPLNRSLELRLSFLTCSLLAAVYLVYGLLRRPSGGQPLEHALGIVGTVLMILLLVLVFYNDISNWITGKEFAGL